jgi:AcrR family transcriptional regulator
LRKDAERNRHRILEAARELFAERGLEVTLNDIAHHAGVGVGTVYRRFPDKAKLIEGLFEQRLQEIGALAQTAHDEPDPWRGLVRFYEQALELQAADRGLNELVLGAPAAPERLAKMRAQLRPLLADLVERARASGQLRSDCEPEDLPMLTLMLSAVLDAGQQLAPDLWRRYLAIVLQGLRAAPGPPEPLPSPAVSPRKLDNLLAAGWKARRG